MMKFIKHAVIRRKAKLGGLPTDRFRVTLAQCTGDYEKAFNLVQVSYAYLGIEHLGKRLFRMTDQHILPEAFVLLAWEEDRVVGTMSVTLDSPGGLPLDKDYPEVLNPLRKTGARLAELGSLAVVQKRRHCGVAQLLGVSAARLLWKLGSTHTVIGIHPKATPIYTALWGFKSIGDPKGHAQLAAPVAAMSVTRDQQRQHLRAKCGVHKSSGRTLEDLVFGTSCIPNCSFDAPGQSLGSQRPQMSRETFQHLFMKQSNHLEEVNGETLAYVKSLRSDETLDVAHTPAQIGLVHVGIPSNTATIQPPTSIGGIPVVNLTGRPGEGPPRGEESGLAWLL